MQFSIEYHKEFHYIVVFRIKITNIKFSYGKMYIQLKTKKENNMETRVLNNIINIAGVIDSDFVYSHEVYGEKFYKVKLKARRLSETVDSIPILVSERLTDIGRTLIGKEVKVSGQVRTYNKREGNGSALKINVFATEFEILEEDDGCMNTNDVILDGYICKTPVYRKTPLNRKITDVLLAVNRPYGKSDYLPCICWGRNAKYVGTFQVGERIRIRGRLQSRIYTKKIDDDSIEERTAYEVSISKLENVRAG